MKILSKKLLGSLGGSGVWSGKSGVMVWMGFRIGDRWCGAPGGADLAAWSSRVVAALFLKEIIITYFLLKFARKQPKLK